MGRAMTPQERGLATINFLRDRSKAFGGGEEEQGIFLF